MTLMHVGATTKILMTFILFCADILATGGWFRSYSVLCCSANAAASPPPPLPLVSPVLRHRLEPITGRTLHLAGQSEYEYGNYSAYLPTMNRPLGYTIYHTITELNTSGAGSAYFTSLRLALERLGNGSSRVVLPHIGLALTPGDTVLEQINSGQLDMAISELVNNIHLVGRPVFLRIGYEFNGHWNNYTAPAYVAAYQRIARRLLNANGSIRDRVALIWDMTCDEKGQRTNYLPFYPGNDYVDWWGVNIFAGTSAPNSSCVLNFVSAAASQSFPVFLAESMPRYIGTDNSSSWPRWFEPFFRQLVDNPAVKAFSYINRDCGVDSSAKAHCVGGQWGDARIETSASVGPRYRQEMARPVYIHGQNLSATCKALGVV